MISLRHISVVLLLALPVCFSKALSDSRNGMKKRSVDQSAAAENFAGSLDSHEDSINGIGNEMFADQIADAESFANSPEWDEGNPKTKTTKSTTKPKPKLEILTSKSTDELEPKQDALPSTPNDSAACIFSSMFQETTKMQIVSKKIYSAFQAASNIQNISDVVSACFQEASNMQNVSELISPFLHGTSKIQNVSEIIHTFLQEATDMPNVSEFISAFLQEVSKIPNASELISPFVETASSMRSKSDFTLNFTDGASKVKNLPVFLTAFVQEVHKHPNAVENIFKGTSFSTTDISDIINEYAAKDNIDLLDFTEMLMEFKDLPLKEDR